MADEFVELIVPATLEVRDLAKRELDMRLLPWDTEIDTRDGVEEFKRGAFAGTDPNRVLFYGINHEARLGLGQGGQPVMTRVPAGKAISISEQDDGAHATVRVARTAAGDEALALAADGIVTGVSVEFMPRADGTDTVRTSSGRRKLVRRSVDLTGITTTPTPAYGPMASVLAIRTSHEGENVSETVTTAEVVTMAPPSVTEERVAAIIASATQPGAESITRMQDRLAKLEEQTRSQIVVPAPVATETKKPTAGQWFSFALRAMSGDRISPQEFRNGLEDITTSDNLGVVPPVFIQDIGFLISNQRPFLESTRQLPIPSAGMTLHAPIIQTRPTAGVQSGEKSDITSTPTTITSGTYEGVSIFGGGDLSIQLLRRSSPEFLTLYFQLLAEAYALESEIQALATLLDSGTTDGSGYVNPEDLEIGEAFANATAVHRLLRPDTMWLSTAGVVAFIDAKASTTNQPLYSDLAANITVAGGAGGLISGLRAIWTPGLDGSGADVVIGPSRGFGWAEDGTFQLAADNVQKAGRDVALGSIMFFAPLYPAAFTTYRLAS